MTLLEISHFINPVHTISTIKSLANTMNIHVHCILWLSDNLIWKFYVTLTVSSMHTNDHDWYSSALKIGNIRTIKSKYNYISLKYGI